MLVRHVDVCTILHRRRYSASIFQGAIMRICAWLITATLLGCFGTARSAERLLLTEVVVAPTQAEYIAIFNPNLKTVYLKDYYLADYETYYLVVDGTPPTSNSDFLVRFPQEASIGPGQTQYLSIAGAECFKTACGTVGPFV